PCLAFRIQNRVLLWGRSGATPIELRKCPLIHDESNRQTTNYGYCDRKRESKLFHDGHGNAPRLKKTRHTSSLGSLWRGLSRWPLVAWESRKGISHPIWSLPCESQPQSCLATGARIYFEVLLLQCARKKPRQSGAEELRQ